MKRLFQLMAGVASGALAIVAVCLIGVGIWFLALLFSAIGIVILVSLGVIIIGYGIYEAITKPGV